MIGEILVINFEGKNAYISEGIFLPIFRLHISLMPNQVKHKVSWIIKVLNYNKISRQIHVEILSYKSGITPFTNFQNSNKELLAEIDQISFRSIDTNGILSTISDKEIQFDIAPKIEVVREGEFNIPKKLIRTEQSIATTNLKPLDFKLKLDLKVAIKNINFGAGRVYFKKFLPEIKKSVYFTIVNENIKPEFDAVKNYFCKIFNTKKLVVNVEIEMKNGDVFSSIATSNEIESISHETISKLKIEVLKTISKYHKENSESNICFTLDNLIKLDSELDIKLKEIFSSDAEFMNEIFKMSIARHYKQLRYLSSLHLAEIMKLRFMLNPFSFIFLLDGGNYYYFVWETLNTEEATYIWQVEKNTQTLKATFKKLVDKIRLIKEGGKSVYITTTKDDFKRVYHDYSNNSSGFSDWKNEIEFIIKPQIQG